VVEVIQEEIAAGSSFVSATTIGQATDSGLTDAFTIAGNFYEARTGSSVTDQSSDTVVTQPPTSNDTVVTSPPTSNDTVVIPPPTGSELYTTECQGCHGPIAGSSINNLSTAGIQSAIKSNLGGMGSLVLTSSEIQSIVDALIAASPPVSTPQVKVPLKVFPGAEGYGTDTPAGRGGQIVKVTNRNDSGPGSLRAAIEFSGPRIVVFEVGGIIDLLSTIEIRNPFITIAGQTAPSPGITLRGKTLQIATHDVLVQHLRMRVGDIRADGSSIDGITIRGSSVYNVVVDHISASWGLDENLGTWESQHDVTISNSIFSEALISPSYGMLIGDYSKNITIVKNLMAHNYARNPLLKGGTSAVVVNNLMYNSTGTFMQTSDDANAGPCYVSAVGNVFVDGPNTPADVRGIKASGATPAGSLFYMDDNLRIGNGPLFSYSTSFDPRVSTPPVWVKGIDIYPGADTERLVLQNVGARPKDRDAVDQRIIREVIARGGKQISSQDEVGGWPDQQNSYRAFIVPANPNGDDDGDGYTNIEEMLHQLDYEMTSRIAK
jgi:hypothetical protein